MSADSSGRCQDAHAWAEPHGNGYMDTDFHPRADRNRNDCAATHANCAATNANPAATNADSPTADADSAATNTSADGATSGDLHPWARGSPGPFSRRRDREQQHSTCKPDI